MSENVKAAWEAGHETAQKEFRDRVVKLVENRLDEAANQCNSGWFWHNDGVLRGLLWALTGEDPGPHLFRRVKDVYLALGARVKDAGDHIHYALPGDPDEELDRCEACDAARAK